MGAEFIARCVQGAWPSPTIPGLWFCLTGEPSVSGHLVEALTVVAVPERPIGLLVEQRSFAPPSFDLHDHRLIHADRVAAPPTPQILFHQPSMGADEAPGLSDKPQKCVSSQIPRRGVQSLVPILEEIVWTASAVASPITQSATAEVGFG